MFSFKRLSALAVLFVLGSSLTAFAAGDSGSTNPLSIDPDLAIFTAIVFLLLMIFLGKFAWGPIMAGLNKRETSIADQIDEAKQNADKANATLQQYEAKLAAAAGEVKAMMADARKEAEAVKDKIVADAKEAAGRERDRALSDIQVAKDAAVRELAQKSVDSAVALAGRMLKHEVDSNVHAQLIQDALDQFPNQN